MFVTRLTHITQFLPQACKLEDEASLVLYAIYLNGYDYTLPRMVKRDVQVNTDGFIRFEYNVKIFDFARFTEMAQATPQDIDDYIDIIKTDTLSTHDLNMLKLICRDRWYKGDVSRLRRILQQKDVDDLVKFACNVMWERSYEDHYTLGQQLSIRITTKLIQSGLDFKHQPDTTAPVSVRGWQDATFEKYLQSITSISEVIKRHVFSKKYICLEVAASYWSDILDSMRQENFKIILNFKTANLLLIEMDDDKNSMMYLRKLVNLFENKIINLLFVTDVEFYFKNNNFMFYLYNSLKFYYYCLKNKFAFENADREIFFLLYTIVALEWFNGGHLNSFTLEKSTLYNPLELSTRRLNSIKRAAQHNRVINCDSEINMDYIRGKRVRTGAHYGKRVVDLNIS
ncbi:p47 protein [Thysanoplusia orichalcea nucleopolyhedrovirus]|uniref:p47 protein n=1 Tax=Thysanoplusia orichalcea nucleopolyhedrovirus TaxID=101850 RepID=L0CJN5_9ABAC|nr:p47 protein [Thysanoplusia orichalcea nucleopolyhedrovirus]AGA16194.1 p47 protein [Thysanoplusia orichalcea nucleopolyhedrovirus]